MFKYKHQIKSKGQDKNNNENKIILNTNAGVATAQGKTKFKSSFFRIGNLPKTICKMLLRMAFTPNINFFENKGMYLD